VIGSKSKEISLSLYVSPHTYGNFKMNSVARRWMRSVLVIKQPRSQALPSLGGKTLAIAGHVAP
jgi:hypothetical protein